MSVFSKILENLGKTISKELDKHASKNASKNAGKNLAKPSVKSDIMPSENPRARGQMQDNIIKEFGTKALCYFWIFYHTHKRDSTSTPTHASFFARFYPRTPAQMH